MIELLIETSKIQESSRIIEIELKSDSEIKIEEIQSSNMKEKEVELKNNQKVLN